MNKATLQLKYRPKDLDAFWGNQTACESVSSQLDRDDPTHAWLISGLAGTGKTTMGRIIASVLCSYDPNNSVNHDYTELDTADFRGIDTVRNVISKMKLSPIESDYRIWLLDECHQLSKDAKDALLKALENTPSHVIFILCTTNPESLGKPIQRRCSKIVLEPLDDELMQMKLEMIVKKEKRTVPSDVLDLIIKKSNGSPGEALSYLDSVIDMEVGTMLREIKKQKSTETYAIDLCRALMGRKRSWPAVARILKELEKEDVESLRYMILGYANKILLSKGDEQAHRVIDMFQDNFYDSKYPGLCNACFSVFFDE